MPIGDIAGRGWTLSDLPTPVMVLRERALAHNLSVMAEYCRAWGVDIAPHGKTTMAPQLWDRQLQAGAWGITAATVDQARVMRASSIPRVLLANELVDPVSIAWVAEQLTDPAFDLICYVDSDRGVTILEEHLRAHRPDRPLSVLVELGFDGGRTGCRTIPEAVHVAGRAASSDVLHLAGVAGYEGTICHDRSPGCLALVLSYLDRLRELTRTMIDTGSFDGDEPIICSAGGSAFFDLVVDRLRGPWPGDADVRVVLRSGCYLTHDAGSTSGSHRCRHVRAREGSSRRWSSGARSFPCPSRDSPSSGSASATCRSTSTCRCRRSCARPTAIPGRRTAC